jgi:hypothetical protein
MNSKIQPKNEVRVTECAARLQMKIQRGFRGLLDQKEIWDSDWKRNSEFQKRLLRRSLDQKMSTLWDATPRVWAVEGFSSAVSSHKKQYLLGQSIVRSHIQTFFRSPPEVPRFGQRNRKIFWINVIHELNRMERNMNDIGDLTADYRALVLFRINLSTLSTLRPQIELGKAMRSRMFDVVQEKLSKHGGRYAREDLEAQK